MAGTVVYHVTMSLDGYITGPGGATGWLDGTGEGTPNPLVRDVDAVLDAATAAAGDAMVAVLGAATARRCLHAGRLNEVLIHLAPVLLGGGTRLFADEGTAPVRLQWIERSEAGPVTNLWARISR